MSNSSDRMRLRAARAHERTHERTHARLHRHKCRRKHAGRSLHLSERLRSGEFTGLHGRAHACFFMPSRYTARCLSLPRSPPPIPPRRAALRLSLSRRRRHGIATDPQDRTSSPKNLLPNPSKFITSDCNSVFHWEN